MSNGIAFIVGSGGVLGTALQREFTESGYRVVGLQRSAAAAGSDDHATSHIVSCDLGNSETTHKTLERLINEYDRADVLVLNAAYLVVAPFMNLSLEEFDVAWRVSVHSTIAAMQAILPTMLRRRSGTIIFSGATASMRGSGQFASLAMTKFALRGLAQSLAREYQSQGIHIAHVILDGLLRGSKSVERFHGNDETALDPIAIAKTYRWLVDQPREAWTHELELRPFQERF